MRGHDVYVVQSTSPPVDAALAELLFLVDACRLAGAERITAIVPYFGYARQDRRARACEPLGARLAGTLLAAAGVDRLVLLVALRPNDHGAREPHLKIKAKGVRSCLWKDSSSE